MTSEPETHSAAPRRAWRRWLLWILPLALVGPSLLPGKRFLPVAPVGFEPLASEYPEAAEAAWRDANRWCVDRVFPTLTDELAVRDAWRAGALPLWSPNAGLGAPLAAGSMSGVWYPPRMLWLWLPPDLAAGLHALLAVFLAGLGMQCFLERRGLSSIAALFGALALQASAFVSVELHLSMKFDAALWLPWMLWAVDGVAQGDRRAPLALGVSVALSFLAGFVPIAVFALTTALAWLVVRTYVERAPRVLATGLVAACLGIALAGVQLLPMREASANSLRGSATAEVIARGRLPEAALLTLVAPKLYGLPTEDRYAPALGAVWWFTDDDEEERELAARAVPLEWNLGVGVLILLLAAAGLAGAGRHALFPGLAALAWLLFVLGLPPMSWLFGVPGFDLGAPSRAACVLWILWPWLAALGLDALRDSSRPARRAALTAGAICAVLGASWAFGVTDEGFADDLHADLPERLGIAPGRVVEALPREALFADAQRIRRQGYELLLLALLASGTVLAVRNRRSGVALGAVLFIEVALLAPHHLAPRDLGGAPLRPSSERMDALHLTADGGRLLRHDTSESGFDEVMDLARPNLPQLYDVADLSSYQIFTPGWQVDLLTLVDPRSPYLTGASRISDADLLDHQLLDRLGADVILSQHDLTKDLLRRTDSAPRWNVYRRNGELTRANVVPSLEYCSNDLVSLELLASHALDPTRTATMVSDGPGGIEREGPLRDADPLFRAGRTEWRRPDPNRFVVRVSDTSGGWLVVREAWYPGWEATVNGTPTEVLRVDHAFRGVRVPAGEVEVEFTYRPTSFRNGVLVGLGALLALLAWFALSRRGIA